MLVKANRITNLTDARYFAAKEVAFMGFNLELGTEGYLDPIYMKAIREWVEGPKIVGEFSNSPAQVVFEATKFYGLETVQVPVTWDISDFLLFEHIETIGELVLEKDYSTKTVEKVLMEKRPFAAYFLVNFEKNNIRWQDIEKEAAFWKSLCAYVPLLFQMDIAPDDLPKLIESIQPAGICLTGGDEERVGVKSFDDIDLIFEKLEEHL